ncbi:DUF4148 domain-containing protein [Paraburkholderia sp.]|uniref:DUF4148 domain-containing protein n=1 Tax=Paraburkholderia sp. TaxID=1926495 RepID=UPI0025EE0B76|nr:DUF4148 domain-containing protein [Paraburkholderia sp.]
MNRIMNFTLALAVLASPALSFAQENTAPVTRAQVRAELVELQQAGYNISAGEDANYPAAIQAAEAKVAAHSGAQQAASGVGGVSLGGSSESGSPMHTPGCIGPASFCNLYFGN